MKELKILILEDSPTVLFDMKTKLEAMIPRINLFMASNYETAVKIMEKEELDVIFVDLIMPGMNGMDFINVFQKSNSNKSKLVVTTKVEKGGLLYESLKNITEDYMVKPISDGDLRCFFLEHSFHEFINISEVKYASLLSEFQNDTWELINIYLSESIKNIELLKNAVENRDRYLVDQILHKMTGAICALRIRQISLLIEDLCRDFDENGFNAKFGDKIVQIQKENIELESFKDLNHLMN